MTEMHVEGDFISCEGVLMARILPGVNASDRQKFVDAINDPHEPDPDLVDLGTMISCIRRALHAAANKTHGLLSVEEIDIAIEKAISEG